METPSASTSVHSVDPASPSSSSQTHKIRDVLAPFSVPMRDVEKRHGALLALVRSLIGVAPNCDSFFEIYPPSFTTYNLLVPNFLNLPFMLWGLAAPADLVSMALYYSSRAARCAYCSLHTCSFALRRGVDEAALSASRQLTPREAAVINAALNMSSYPNQLSDDDRARLYRYLSASDVEWMVLGVAMMGFLTTFMNAVGVDMESTTVDEVSTVLEQGGWSIGKHNVIQPQSEGQKPEKNPQRRDTFFSNLSMLKHLPAAKSFDKNATSKIPESWPEIGELLSNTVGYSFPVLGLMTHNRAARAVAEVIRLNFDPSISGVQPGIKYLAGLIFAGVQGNRLMTNEFRAMAVERAEFVDEAVADDVFEFSKEGTDFCLPFDATLANSTLARSTLSPDHKLMLYLAKACTFAPTHTTPAVVKATKAISPQHTVELVSWISVLVMLQKLYVFYYPRCSEQVEEVDVDLMVGATYLTETTAAHME